MTHERQYPDWRREVEAISSVGDEARDAERIDAALSAARVATGPDYSGVDTPAGLRITFGSDAADLAALTARLVQPAAWRLPAPDTGFTHALEARLLAAFEQPAAGAVAPNAPDRRRGRLPEMLLVGGAAAVLAMVVFLLNPGRGIAPEPPPTVEAATETATLVSSATPEVALTVAPEDAATDGTASDRIASSATAPTPTFAVDPTPSGDVVPGQSSRHPLSIPSSVPQDSISGDGDNAGMNTQTTRLLAYRTVRHPARGKAMPLPAFTRSSPLLWDLPPAEIDAPLPSRATFEAGKAALMALAASKQVERARQTAA